MLFNKNLYGFLLLSSVMWSQQENTTLSSQDSLQITRPSIQLEEVVLVDSRFPLKSSKSGKPIIKINRKEIEQFQGEELSTLIRNYSGINVLGSRTYPGQNKTLSIRGGRNRQVLVMIDGVRVSDPARIDNDFELTFLNLQNIESIEIQKGAASTLYGSSAATGVINIVTKKTAQEAQLALQSSLGTARSQEEETALSSFRNTAFYSNTFGKLGVKFNASHFYTDGMSAVTGEEKDPFMRYSLGTRINNDPNANFNWALGFDKAFIRSDYDNTFPIEDASFSYTKSLNRVQFTPNFNYKNGGISLLFGYQNTDREFESDFPFTTASENINIDLFNKFVFKGKLYTVFGLQYQSNYTDAEGAKKTNQKDVYANLVYNFSEAFRINSGVRLNTHSAYGNHLTYSINPSYTFELKEASTFKILSALSTAYIAPSLFQLYDPFSGNETLKPEENQSFEVGLNYNTPLFGTTMMFFNRVESPSLIYDLVSFRYANATDEALYRGIELDFRFDLKQNTTFNINYTFTETQDGDLRYLPKHALNGSINYRLNKKASMLLNIQHIGNRFALDNLTVLKAYTLLDLRFNYQFKNPQWSSFIAATNLFNQKYIEIEGFSTRGRNVMTGISYKLN